MNLSERCRAIPRPWRFAILCAGLLGGLVLGVGWRALLLGETFVARDLRNYYHAAKAIVVPLTQAWQGVPLWNPLFASGQPFAANPEHEVFHPLTGLLFLLPFEWAFRAQVLLPLVCAALSMFLLLRSMGRSQLAALFGGIAWGFGGYLLSTTNLLPILFAVSVLPLVLFFAIRTASRGRAADIVGLAISFGLMCLAGEPSTLLATPPLLAAAVARRHWSWARRATVVAAVALGTLIGAATLLPGLHHASKTVRVAGMSAAVANKWSLPPVRALELVTPNVPGHFDRAGDEAYWGERLYPGPEFPFLLSLYPGLLTTVLALAGWWIRRRTHWPWIAVAAIGYLVALGGHLPLWGLLRRLPLISGLRYPEKFALLFCLPLVIGAAHGFDQVVHATAAARRKLAPLFLGVSALALLLAAGLLAFMAPSSLRPLLLQDAARLTIAGLACAALFRFWPRGSRRTGAILACAVLALDLGSAGRSLLPTEPVAALSTPPRVLRPILGQPDRLLFHLAEWQPASAYLDGLASPPVPAQWGLATTLEKDFDLTQLRWTSNATAAFFRVIREDEALMMPLLRRRGVTHVLRFREGVRWQGKTLIVPPGTRSPLELVTVEDPRPFAFAPDRVERIQGVDGWMKAVQRLGDAVSRTASISSASLGDFPAIQAPATVVVKERTLGRTRIDVDARGPGPSLVAINQSWDDGWQASIDGEGARLLRADVDLSAIVVPPGRHQVELVYRNRWVEAGIGLSVLACALCLALVIRERRRRGRSP